MAKQQGMINVRGTVGDVTYRQTKTGFRVGLKSKLNAETIRTSEKFENTRRVNTEFGSAGKAGKLIRDAITLQLDTAGDGSLTQRMQRLMMQILKSDGMSDFGQRRVENGDLGLLNDFEFNQQKELNKAFLVQTESVIDRAAGELKVNVPGFIASLVLRVPAGASHFNLVTAGCALDFPNQKFECGMVESQYFQSTNTPIAGFTLTNTIAPDSLLPLMIVLGIRFYNKVNGKYYRMKGDEFNAMRVVAIDNI